MSDQVAEMTGTRPPARDVEERDLRADPGGEPIVLLDPCGRPSGTLPKRHVHHDRTPLHLGFSCHVVTADGRVLLTRRSSGKRTWPGTWSNACCGHPQPGETLRRAVERRLQDELGLVPRRMALALPDFAYRAVMDDGVVEHELCPVVVAEVDRVPLPNPHEVDGIAWVTWDALRARAAADPASLSPWAVEQVGRLAALAPSPLALLEGASPVAAAGAAGLDRPAALQFLSGAATIDGPDDPVAVVRAPVERTIDAFLSDRLAEVADLDPAAIAVAAEVQRLVRAGGKRLRPAFAYWGHRATGAPHDDGVIAAAAALELLHTFALLHDDVMDRSPDRRGQPTAHRNLAEAHRREGLAGDGGWFGVGGAVLAGDLAYLWSTQLLAEGPLPSEALDRGRRVFARLCTEVIAGQYLDLRLAAHDGAGQADAGDALARRVALLKSARYTVTRPLQLGAALAGPSADADADALDAVLEAYGDAVGLAFQLRDDVLGLFGDPAVTGKGRLDDLREGKRTLLVVRALRLAPDRDGRFLAGALGDPELDETTAERCREIVASSGALASVEALIAARRDEAVMAAQAVGGPARTALEALAARTVERDR